MPWTCQHCGGRTRPAGCCDRLPFMAWPVSKDTTRTRALAHACCCMYARACVLYDARTVAAAAMRVYITPTSFIHVCNTQHPTPRLPPTTLRLCCHHGLNIQGLPG